MPKTDIHTFSRLIQRSLLLSEERKETLLSALPMLNTKQLQQLGRLLKVEPKIIEDLIGDAVSTLVDSGDTKELKKLTHLLKESNTSLREADERAERTEEGEDLESFFDDIQ